MAAIRQSIPVQHDLRVPVRDGIALALDVLHPRGDGPHPVILERTPYDKTLVRASSATRYDALLERGYAVAVNDCRGRFNSDGVFTPYMNEHDDGYDVVEWIAAQTWCDGNVGMIGASYAGQTQWFAASRTPPHLKAIVPIVSPPSSLWRNEPIVNGVLLLLMAEWMVSMGRRSWQVPFGPDLLSARRDYYDTLSVSDLPAAAGVVSDWWQEWMDHPTYDNFWRAGEYGNHEAMTVASLNITGWWDMNFPGAPLNFEAMQASTPGHHQLIIGPWPHRVNLSRELSGVTFADSSLIDLDERIGEFFDRHLKGMDDAGADRHPVQVYVLGADEWWYENEWPLARTRYTEYFLHSDGSADRPDGNGRLDIEPPIEDEPADHYVYDPADPVDVTWQLAGGPVDDTDVLRRDDVLCYTTDVLDDAIDVVGWVSCRLFASSSATDTDWHLRLLDVQPDGTSRFLCRGTVRARFRSSWTVPTLLNPDEVTEFDIGLDAAGVRFLPGHRIRLVITSSWFTQYARNMNEGTPNPFTEDTPTPARQAVHHRPDFASRLVLPVIPGGHRALATRDDERRHPTSD